MPNHEARVQVRDRTLDINKHALHKIKEYNKEYAAQLIYEADIVARTRGGNEIQFR